MPEEQNPFLGWRSIRVSLELASVFKTQLRAILRASARGPLRVMLPMISSLEELRRSKELIAEAKAELRAEGRPFDDAVPLGMMVEVPSAVQLADRFIEEVDFFSIGTNDLIQYGLAIDRGNKQVAHMYQPLDPAVIRMIKHTTDVARANRIPVHMCGEMAGRPLHAPLLLGLGLNELSMNPQAIPQVKRMIRSISLAESKKMVKKILNLRTAREVFEVLRDSFGELVANHRRDTQV
jgi:phosphotransferase system enzyme I (PtsI)